MYSEALGRGMFSATVCYPLDTIRRRMQMKGKTYNGMLDAFVTIFKKEGAAGFFKGWAANTLKARRCRLAVSKPVLKARMVSALEARI